jgi:hypothetical protein
MSPRYDVPKAAPEPLRGVQLLVNTWDDEHGREVDATRLQLEGWLRERGVDEVDAWTIDLPPEGAPERPAAEALLRRVAALGATQVTTNTPLAWLRAAEQGAL